MSKSASKVSPVAQDWRGETTYKCGEPDCTVTSEHRETIVAHIASGAHVKPRKSGKDAEVSDD